jgi:hypothetical protein
MSVCVNLLVSTLTALEPHSSGHGFYLTCNCWPVCTVQTFTSCVLPSVVHCTVVNAFEGTLKFALLEQ